MKKILILAFVLTLSLPLFSQSFSLPGDGNWYRVATMGGAHSNFQYVYQHNTANNPSVTSGEIDYINAQNLWCSTIRPWDTKLGINRNLLSYHIFYPF